MMRSRVGDRIGNHLHGGHCERGRSAVSSEDVSRGMYGKEWGHVRRVDAVLGLGRLGAGELAGGSRGCVREDGQ